MILYTHYLQSRPAPPIIKFCIICVCGEWAFWDVVVVLGTWASEIEAKDIEPRRQCTEEAKVQFGLYSTLQQLLHWAFRVLGIKSETIHVVLLSYQSYQLRCCFCTEPHHCTQHRGMIITLNITILTINIIWIQKSVSSKQHSWRDMTHISYRIAQVRSN